MKIFGAEVLASKANLSRDQWLELRRGGIGGSDAAGIMGLSPYSSPYSVWADKKGLLAPKQDNEAMRQGRDFEGYVAKRFVEHMLNVGITKKVKECNYILQNPKHPFMLANVDRLIIGEKAGLECKTTSVLNLKRFKNGEFPLEYYAQCVHYMAVTGAKRWYLGVLVLNQGFYCFTIERDEEEIKALIETERVFWQDNILQNKEPLPIGSESDSETLKTLYPEADNDMQVDLFAYEKELDIIHLNSKRIKQLTEEVDKAKQAIQMYMKNAGVGDCANYLVTWKGFSQQRVDTNLLKTNYFNVYESVLKSINSRKFTIKKMEDK